MRLVKSLLKIEYMAGQVRRIPINVRSLTGEVNGQEFESSLERDLLLLTHWDGYVDNYQVQPVTITYSDANDKQHKYTPDLFIEYRNKDKSRAHRKPILCEVKYREDLFKDWKILKPKFKAARKFAKNKGWQFKIYTEKEIRTTYLKNVQFLWSYSFSDFDNNHYDKLMMVFRELVETTPEILLNATYSSKRLRGEALWTLWCMISQKWVKCDLHLPLTMNSTIWIDP